jgi:hypothetical protein
MPVRGFVDYLGFTTANCNYVDYGALTAVVRMAGLGVVLGCGFWVFGGAECWQRVWLNLKAVEPRMNADEHGYCERFWVVGSRFFGVVLGCGLWVFGGAK